MEIDPVEITLRDGRRATLRAIHEGDRDKLKDAIHALSVESRYYRFFSPMPKVPSTLLDRATRPDADRELQLVAVAGEGADEKIIAGARYGAVAGGDDCEFGCARSFRSGCIG